MQLVDKEVLEKMFLVDVHTHLDELDDLSDALQEAKTAGIKGIIGVGVNVDSNKKILEIAEENHGYVYPALGYHPWQMREDEVEENLSFIREHIDKYIALGEIGLDYKINPSTPRPKGQGLLRVDPEPRFFTPSSKAGVGAVEWVKVKKDLQWKVFGELLDIALEHDKPIIVHCRFSYRKALEMVVGKGIKRAVFHWYSGPLDFLEEILNNGYFISATPALVYSPPHQEAIKRAPLERILLETDSPVSYQGKEARPKDVRISLKEVTRLKGLDLLVVSKQTTANASLLFQIALDL